MVVKQSDINFTLMNKLQEDDIQLASALSTKGALRNQLLFDIICRKDCNCSEKDKNLFTLPEGNISTDIMVIGDVPSEQDGRSHTTMFDADGRMFTIILDRLGLKRDNIYVTNVCKCHNNCSTMSKEQVDNVVYGCASKFLLREIDLVKPKKIITLGLLAANVIRQLILELPEASDVVDIREKGFNGSLVGNNIEVFHTYSPSFVLSKNGALYSKYKLDLWNDIKLAFN